MVQEASFPLPAMKSLAMQTNLEKKWSGFGKLAHHDLVNQACLMHILNGSVLSGACCPGTPVFSPLQSVPRPFLQAPVHTQAALLFMVFSGHLRVLRIWLHSAASDAVVGRAEKAQSFPSALLHVQANQYLSSASRLLLPQDGNKYCISLQVYSSTVETSLLSIIMIA